MPIFTTSFTQPPALTGLAATPDPATSSIVLAWTASAIAAAEFDRYYVYRRDVETGILERVGEVAVQASPTFADIAAPHGVAVDYHVTVSNGWAESSLSDMATATLALLWWFIHPTDTALRFAVPHVSGYSEGSDDGGSKHSPLGRSTPVVVSDGTKAPAGSFSALLLYNEGGVWFLLRRLLDAVPWVWLKDPFGQTLKVRVRSARRDRGQAGVQTVSVSWAVVAP